MSRVLGLVLAAVFVVSAVSKLARPDSVDATLAALVPPRWVGPAGRALPMVELALAALLVVTPAWGGVVAFGLLALFSAVLAGLVRSGAQVPCSCFGSVSQAPVSWRHLVRNAVLMLVAVVTAVV